MLSLTEEQQYIRQNILIWTEKGRSAVITIERGKNEYSTNNDRITLLDKQIVEFEKDSKEL